MRRIIKILFVLITLISFVGCGKDKDKILDYLEGKYKEEFIIKYEVPTRKGGTMAIVIPKRYLGTPKEIDKFYEAGVTYRDGEIRKDDYIWVKNRESIEAYVKPELEKLFGKNIIIALDGGKYRDGNFKEDLKLFKNSVTEEEKEENSFQIEGGIYIFGRVENEKDREKYRRGIYEFIQYLKQEGMFEYCNIWITVVDERFLSKNFNTEEFIEKYNADATKTKENYRKERRRLIKKYDDDFKNTSEKEKRDKIGSLIKSDLYGTNAIGMDEVSGENELLVVGIFSPKFLNRYSDSKQYWINEGGITEDYNGYNSINEVKFYEEKY